jgi:diguanylate cyclase (GGDEF)-like protein/PAS domain S-box-containing protein
MMKEEHKIMMFAALLAAATWVADAAIDSMVFHEGAFVDLLFYDVPAHEVYFRSLFVVSLLVFGYVITRLVAKRRAAEEIARKQSAAIESSMDGIAIYDRDDTYVYVNQAYAKLNGYDSPAEIIGKTYRLMYNEQERTRMDQFCVPALKKSGRWRGELIATRKNGNTYVQEASVTMLEDGGRICIVRDISWRKRSEARLQRSERFLSTIFDSIRDPFCIFDRDYKIVRVNDAYAQMKNLHLKDLLGKKCYEVLHNGTTVCDNCVVQKSLQSADPCAKDKPVTLPNGDEVWFEIYTYPILDEDGKVSHVIEYTRDITDRKKFEEDRRRMIEKLEYLSRTDSLTGLMNRRALTDSLAYELERAKRYGTELSLILCDIDNFKEINDTWGHDTGDRSLQIIAATLKTILRNADIVGRYGGDEFMLILPETSENGGEGLAGKLLSAARDTDLRSRDGQPIRLSMSIGVACVELGNDTMDSFIKRADDAMYASKQAGRNRVSTAGHT